MGERVTADGMVLVDELTLSGDDGDGYLALDRPVLITAGQRYWVDGSDLVVEDDVRGTRRFPGYRPGFPRREAAKPRTFRALITSAGRQTSERASVMASDYAEARAKLEAEFGVGTVSHLSDVDAASRRR